MATYSWCITDDNFVKSRVGQGWHSPVFRAHGLPWFLNVHPNGRDKSREGYVNLYLTLAMLPPQVKSVHVVFTLSLKETGTVHHNPQRYTQETLSAGWTRRKLQSAEIKKHKQWTFTVKIELLNVFDHNDMDITARYLQQNNQENVQEAKQNQPSNEQQVDQLNSVLIKLDQMMSNFQQLEQRVNDIELMVNEEHKNNEKVIHEIKQDIATLTMSKKSRLNARQQALQHWLQNDVGFPQYFDVFIQHGIEDLDTASLITAETLKGIGIDKIGHQMKILHQVVKLKQNDNQEGTAYM